MSKDDAVRQILHDHGDNPARPRATRFFFYGGDLGALHDAAVEQGFDVDPLTGPPGHDDGLLLSTTTPVDEHSFVDLNDLFAEWSEDFGCRYDGWETEIAMN